MSRAIAITDLAYSAADSRRLMSKRKDGELEPGGGAGHSDAMLKAEAAERGTAPDSVLTRFARRGLSLAM